MQSQRALLVSLSSLALSAPALASSSFSLPQLFGGGQQLNQLQRAYQAVHQDPAMRQLLQDTGTHALSVAGRVDTSGVATTKFQHYYKGLEVMGSMSFHHATLNGEQVRDVVSRFDLDVRPTVSAETAVAIAQSVAGEGTLGRAPELKIFPSPKGGSARLIYWVDFASVGLNAGSDVLVDAQSGKVLAHLSKLQTIAPVQVVSAKKQGLQVTPVVGENPETGKAELQGCKLTDLAKGSEELVKIDRCKSVLRGLTPLTDNQCQLILMDNLTSGGPLMVDPSSCAQVVTDGVASAKADKSAKNALSNTLKTLTYFKDNHGRDSFDNGGTEVVSAVHVGLNYGNAAWVQGLDFMLYGDGDGEEMGDMTLGVDVAGHEMTHGITSKTAKLAMMYESGALNEAYSDFFGKMIAQDGSWVVGESLSLDKDKFAGIRDLKNPHSLTSGYRDEKGEVIEKPYPAKVSEQKLKTEDTVCGASNDRCWVHYNATIPGHASYLIHEAIGKEKTEQLYYLTLTSYLTSESTFKQAAEATLSACAAKFDDETCSQVRAAFVEVGML